MTFDFHPDARREFHEAVHWYENHSLFAGDRFVKAVRESIEQIMLDPDRYQNLDDELYGFSLHVFRLKVFPYRLYYTHENEENMIRIFAVMHEKRKPDYWHHRLQK
ncbi:MAG: type II toxin-antitoxin system RelE/ParE family toxin [Prosthecobacter sp.]